MTEEKEEVACKVAYYCNGDGYFYSTPELGPCDCYASRYAIDSALDRSEARHAAVVAELVDALDDAQEFARYQGYRDVSDEWKAIIAKHKGGRDDG